MKKRFLPKFTAIAIMVALFVSCTGCKPDPACPQNDTPMKQQVQAYLEHNRVEEANHQFAPGYSAYFDFSDGIQCARNNNEIEKYYNKIASFISGFPKDWIVYALENEQIKPLDYSQTDLNNAIRSVECREIMAPINVTLEKIVRDDKLALLVTDFEEYDHSAVMGDKNIIEDAPYLTEDFEAWLLKGGIIKFYIMDYVEYPKSLPALNKKLFFVVFDDKERTLSTEIDKLFRPTNPDELERYKETVKEFELKGESFKVYNDYRAGRGGNYEGQYDPMAVQEYGYYDNHNAEFYEMGNRWDQVFGQLYQAKIKDKSCDGLLSKLYIDLSDEESRSINQLELRVTDITDDFEAYSQYLFAMRYQPSLTVDENGDTIASFNLESDTACFFDQEGHLLFEYEYDGSIPKTVIKDNLFEINQDIFRESRKESPEKTRIVVDFAKVYYEAYGYDDEIEEYDWNNEDMQEVIQSFNGRVLQVDVCVALTGYDESQSLDSFKFESHLWKKNGKGEYERKLNATNDCVYGSINNVYKHSRGLNNKGKVIYTFIIRG